MQKLMGRMRAAMEKYEMIEDGDVVAVGLSGGKDSAVMLAALAAMRSYYPKKYEVKAITVDMRFSGEDSDYSVLADFCDEIGVQYIVKRTRLAELIFDERKESNPCSLCSKMRRGILDNTAVENGCNKLALGHHMDDAAETFMMNLLKGGNIACFSPVTHLSRSGICVIRPMVLASEALVAGTAKKRGVPVIKSACPMDKTSEREKTKTLIRCLNRDYPKLREKIVGALERKEIDNW